MFTAYRIRPVVEHTDPDGKVSYRAAASLAEAERDIDEFNNRQVFNGREGLALMWGIYGVNPPEDGVSTEDSISDTPSEEAAKQFLAKIIGPFQVDEHGYCTAEPAQNAQSSSNTPPEGMDYWKDQDKSYPLSDWQQEVANGDTRAAYWEWAFAARHCDSDCEGQPEQSADVPPPAGGKRIMARFIPEAWIDGYATEIDGAVEFDVTEQVLAMSEAERATLRDDSLASDNLVPDSILSNHNGPFRVELQQAIEDYFADDTALELA